MRILSAYFDFDFKNGKKKNEKHIYRKGKKRETFPVVVTKKKGPPECIVQANVIIV